jgi:hypothetical protein
MEVNGYIVYVTKNRPAVGVNFFHATAGEANPVLFRGITIGSQDLDELTAIHQFPHLVFFVS